MRPRPTSTRTLEALRARRDEIVRLAAEYGASNVRVFGSVARGEDDEQSDIDLLVDMTVYESEGGFAYFGRLWDLKEALTHLLTRNVDVLDSGALKNQGITTRSREKMRQRVLTDAVDL